MVVFGRARAPTLICTLAFCSALDAAVYEGDADMCAWHCIYIIYIYKPDWVWLCGCGYGYAAGRDSGRELATAIPSLPLAMLQLAAVGMKGGISHIYAQCLIVI